MNRNRQRSTQPLDFFTLAYVAGFFDGEGTVGVYRRKVRTDRRSGSQPTYFVALALTSTHRPTIDWLYENFGGAIHGPINKDYLLPNAQDAWRWMANHRVAYGFLSAIAPFARLKRPQILNALAFLDLPKQARRTPELIAEQKARYEAHVALGLRHGQQGQGRPGGKGKYVWTPEVLEASK